MSSPLHGLRQAVILRVREHYNGDERRAGSMRNAYDALIDRWSATTVADLTLTDVAFGVALLTAFFGFYARFIRPGLVWRKDMEARVDKLQVDMEARVDKLQMYIEMHSETDTKLLSAVQSMGRDIGEIKTKIAVLEERSQRWGA